MSNIYKGYNSITGVYLQPIEAMQIFLQGITDSYTYKFFHVESESSYSITPKTVTDGKGRQRTLGYVLDATIYLLQNDINGDGAITLLESMRNVENLVPNIYTSYSVALFIGSSEGSSAADPAYTDSADKGFTITVPSPQLNITIGGVEMRSRISVKFSYFTKNLSSIIS